ncbi:GIY-YIG nuclease family protein [Photobacterium leiognathi]|uniref:GIY-YIG nuclease family protein n=1 Tax=Photobacterium leiognathi TaxID=553611 RepID=UPI002980E935|nr:GIY-YIG nuclease family protein [Photobacterium leiognathi]
MTTDMWSQNYHEATTFYIARSKEADIIKIGITKNIKSRIKNLNSHKLGGVEDFKIVTSVELGKTQAGEFETAMLKIFKQHKTYTDFQSKSEDTYSNETLRVPVIDLVLAGEALLKGRSKETLEFVSCREHHKQDLWGKDKDTHKLREIRSKYTIVNSNHKIVDYLWVNHGVIPGRTTVF